MKVVLTGSKGFIGSALLKALRKQKKYLCLVIKPR